MQGELGPEPAADAYREPEDEGQGLPRARQRVRRARPGHGHDHLRHAARAGRSRAASRCPTARLELDEIVPQVADTNYATQAEYQGIPTHACAARSCRTCSAPRTARPTWWPARTPSPSAPAPLWAAPPAPGTPGAPPPSPLGDPATGSDRRLATGAPAAQGRADARARRRGGAASGGGRRPSPPRRASSRRRALNIQVRIPDNLVLRGQSIEAARASVGDLNATLGGDFRVAKTAGKPVVLLGAVNTVRGTTRIRDAASIWSATARSCSAAARRSIRGWTSPRSASSRASKRACVSRAPPAIRQLSLSSTPAARPGRHPRAHRLQPADQPARDGASRVARAEGRRHGRGLRRVATGRGARAARWTSTSSRWRPPTRPAASIPRW